MALISQEERRETKGNTDYFPVAHFSLLINQTSNIPRSSSIKNVKKNLREVPSVQPKHRRRISVKHNWNSRCPDPVCVCERESERLSACLFVCESHSTATAAASSRRERDGKYCSLCTASSFSSFKEILVKCMLTNSICCLYSCLL